jgi:hypothetical protein
MIRQLWRMGFARQTKNMKIKSKINFLGALLFGALFLMGGSCRAQEDPSFDPRTGGDKVVDAVVVATVNIGDVKIVSWEENTLKLSFAMSNQTGVQNDVRYAVELRDPDEGLLADRKIYDEVLFLGEGQVVRREVTYEIPDYLRGRFQVFIASRNEKGMSFGAVLAEDIDLEGGKEFVRVDSKNCYLSVAGGSEKYALRQGVDVAPEEELVLHCLVESFFKKETLVIPNLKTTFRSAFGKIVSEKTGEAVSFWSEEAKDVAITIPRAEVPQAYDVNVLFRDGSGKAVANPVFVHYVLQGKSGTINNVTLDKDSYAKGETAQVAFLWSGRADDFPQSRIGKGERRKALVKISTLGESGQDCADPFSRELDPEKDIFLGKAQVKITGDCAGGKMIVALADDEGTVLDEKVVEFKKVSGIEKNKPGLAVILYVGAGIILLVGIALVLVRKWKSGGVAGTAILLIFFGLLTGGKPAQAINFALYNYWTAIFTVNLGGGRWDADMVHRRYCPGEIISVTMTGEWPGCLNAADSVASTAFVNGQKAHPFFERESTEGHGTKRFTAPMIPGTYVAEVHGAIFNKDRFDVNDQDYLDARHDEIYYVDSCSGAEPIPGSCGGAHQGSFASAPTSGRCSYGTATSAVLNVSGTRWAWTCNGSNGGASSSCWAYHATNPAPIGYHEGSDNASCSISGWAYDASDLNQSIKVHVYRDGPAGGGGVFLKEATANVSRTDVQSSYGTPMANYGFSVPLGDTSVNDGAIHSIYAYAISIPDGTNNRLLTWSPRTLQCAPAPIAGVCGPANGKTLSSPPTTERCLPGTLTAVNLVGSQYQWQCLGLNGGATSPLCTATYSSVNPFSFGCDSSGIYADISFSPTSLSPAGCPGLPFTVYVDTDNDRVNGGVLGAKTSNAAGDPVRVSSPPFTFVQGSSYYAYYYYNYDLPGCGFWKTFSPNPTSYSGVVPAFPPGDPKPICVRTAPTLASCGAETCTTKKETVSCMITTYGCNTGTYPYVASMDNCDSDCVPDPQKDFPCPCQNRNWVETES